MSHWPQQLAALVVSCNLARGTVNWNMDGYGAAASCTEPEAAPNTADPAMTAGEETRALLSLLDWYAAMGVDIAIEEEAVDRFQPVARVAAPASSPAPARAPQLQAAPPAAAGRAPAQSLVSPDAALQSARELAAAAGTLEELRAVMEAFEGCALKQSATRLAFADGNPAARIMLVGEAPGREEDEQGKPFVGKAGKLLDRMLAAIGLDRTQVYIANVVPWRPPGNRTPTPQEIAICLPFITRQIELCAPDVLVCIGAPSSQTILGQRDGILRLRGRWFDYLCGERRIPALATLHPAYLLRVPAQKKLAWHDLRSLEEKIRAENIGVMPNN